MIWKARYTQVNFEAGATRLKRVFAWLPKHVQGYIVWLSFYEIIQVNVANTYQAKEKDKTFAVIVYNWVDTNIIFPKK